MQEILRIEDMILRTQKEYRKKYYLRNSAVYKLLSDSYNDVNSQIQQIDEELQKLGKVKTDKYYILMNKRKRLLAQRESFLQDIQKEEDKYNLSPEGIDKKIEAETNLKLRKILAKELTTIERKIHTIIQEKNSEYAETLEDLLNAQAFCKIKLNELEDKENPETSHTSKKPSYEIVDDLNKTRTNIYSCEIIDDFKKTRSNINYYKTIDVLENAYNHTDYYTNNIPKSESTIKMKNARSKNVQNPNTQHSNTQSKEAQISTSEIIDDMEQACQDYKNNINQDKKIYIHIADNDFKVSFPSLHEMSKNMYEDLNINEMCEQIAGGGILGKMRSSHLAKKINPITIKCLDSIGDYELIQEYIKSIYNKKPFPFELSFDLKNLSRIQKWQFQRFIKSEQKSGAKIIEKLANKNNSLPKSSELTNHPVGRPAFFKKFDGNNEKIAKNFRENSQKQDQQEINPTSQLESYDSLESH